MRALMLVGLAALLAVTPAWGLRIISGNEVIVSDTTDDDLLVTGRRVSVQGDVTGDLLMFGETTRLQGRVGGSVMTAGRRVELGGSVDGSAYLAGQTVAVSGSITRNLSAAGNEVTVSETARVGRDLSAAAGGLLMAGQVGRRLQASASSLDLDGRVGGNVRFEGKDLALGEHAVVGGDLVYRAEDPARMASGAVVRGAIRMLGQPRRHRARLLGSLYPIISALGFLLVALLLALLFPRVLGHAAEEIMVRPWVTLGVGVLALLAVPLAALLLLVTIIGIPLSLLVILAYVLAIYLANVVLAAFLGGVILQAFRGRGHLAWATLLGALVLVLLDQVPFVAAIANALVLLFGLGAITLTTWWLIKGRPSRPAPPAPAAASPPEAPAAT